MFLVSFDPGAACASAEALSAAGLEVYEAATRAVSELEWFLSRNTVSEPVSSLARACGDLTRDTAAVQLSTARWILDL